MAVRLNYDSAKSKVVISQVLAFLLGRPLAGATQQQIAAMLDVSHGTANRFIQHLVMTNQIHVERKARATNAGHLPAIYQLGPPVQTRFPERAIYSDLPLNFFGRTRMNTSNNTKPIATQLMTDWYAAHAFHPQVVGPFECLMIVNGEGEPHFRWWNGEHWSLPLQPEHQIEGKYFLPNEDYFVRTDLDEFLHKMEWRGFTEDQDEL